MKIITSFSSAVCLVTFDFHSLPFDVLKLRKDFIDFFEMGSFPLEVAEEDGLVDPLGPGTSNASVFSSLRSALN